MKNININKIAKRIMAFSDGGVYKDVFMQILNKMPNYRRMIIETLTNICISEGNFDELQELASSNLLKQSEQEYILDRLSSTSEDEYDKFAQLVNYDYDKELGEDYPIDMLDDTRHRPNRKYDKFEENKKRIDIDRRNQRNWKNNQFDQDEF